ncbi:MAG: hypothetical protein WBW47_03595 [Thermoplasmata archaeon]
MGDPEVGVFPVTVSTWFTSSFVPLGVGAAGAVKAELTVTVEEGSEVVVSGSVALSVNWSSKA